MNNRQQTASRYVSNFEQQRAEIRERVKAMIVTIGPNKLETFLNALQIIKDGIKDNKSPVIQILVELGSLEMDSILAEWMAE